MGRRRGREEWEHERGGRRRGRGRAAGIKERTRAGEGGVGRGGA